MRPTLRTLPLVALAAVCLACNPPGEVGRGAATVTIRGDRNGPIAWDGPCIHERLTRWQSALRHQISLPRPDHDLTVQLHFRRRPRPGVTWLETDVELPMETGVRLWLRDGGIVSARTLGEVRVRDTEDGFALDVEVALLPQGGGHDTVRISANCTIARPG